MSQGILFRAFAEFLAQATAAQISFAQIRERTLDEQTALSPGDYDFFVQDESLEAFLELLYHQAAAHCLPLLICRQKREKTKVTLYSRDGKDSILLDLWIRLEVKDPARRTRSFIQSRDLVSHLEIRDGVTRLPARLEALYYLSHVSTKSKKLGADQVQERLRTYAKSMESDVDVGALLQGLIEGGCPREAALVANGLLMDCGVLRSKWSGPFWRDDLATLLSDRLYKLRGKLVAKRRFIAVVGPDGVGKTTLSQAAAACLKPTGRSFRFKKLYRQALLYKLMHGHQRKSQERQAGRDLAKNQVDDGTGLFVFWLAWSRYYLLALLKLRRSYSLVDRYFFELLITGLRFKEQLPSLRPGWQRLLRFVPCPRLVLHLDAPNEVIGARNQELRSEGLDCYREQMFALSQKRRVPFYLYLNTANSVEECSAVFRSALGELRIPASVAPPTPPTPPTSKGPQAS